MQETQRLIAQETVRATKDDDRRMTQAVLFGSHTHLTASGKRIHIWQRGGRYIARGRIHGRHFGETLGCETQAPLKLRRMLALLDDEAY